MRNITNPNRPADIVKLDVHDWNGFLIHRVKSKATDKTQGVKMMSLVKEIYNINESEHKQIEQDILNKELKEQKKLIETPADRLRKEINTPIKWNTERRLNK